MVAERQKNQTPDRLPSPSPNLIDKQTKMDSPGDVHMCESVYVCMNTHVHMSIGVSFEG